MPQLKIDSENAVLPEGTPFTISLFGPIQVLVQGQPLPHFHSRKSLWLLALLALRHSRPVERAWLAGTLWPDVDQANAFANLRPVMSHLRKALGQEGGRLQSPNRHTLILDLAGAAADVVTFDAAIADGSPLRLAEAVALYRAPLLEGVTEEWIGQERQLREQQCFHALLRLAGDARASGDYGTAAAYSRRAVGLDTLSDSARLSLMDSLFQGGDTNAALDVYREFLSLLRQDNPKSAPDAKTTALYSQLRQSAQKQSRSISPRPNPALETVNASRPIGTLPYTLTELVGREDETVEVFGFLQKLRLVTLTGPGGIGKTRLALEVAGQSMEAYADGVWFVALESVTEGRLVVEQVAAVLGVQEAKGRIRQEQVAEYLRSKRLLLVLDNCEHVLAASAEFAGQILRECANIRILATSREALGITGELVWAVPCLMVPSLKELPAGKANLLRVLKNYPSVELFVDRAQAVQKGFALTGTNALFVAQISVTLGGIPLALELAAARVKAMTVEQIAERLQNHRPLNLLTGGSRTALSRQRTLRGALDWSYELLTQSEQLLLQRLSIFAGGWTLEAAEFVCSEGGIATEQILDLLTSLVDKSLVVFEAQNGAKGRYRLLEMLHQYGVEHLEASGEAFQVKARHRDWFLSFAESIDSPSRSAAEETWTHRLETEHDNLRAALEWSTDADAAVKTQTALQLAVALAPFWKLRGYLSEGRNALDRVLALPSSQGRTLTRALALNRAGSIALDQGEYAAAQAFIDQALGIFRERGDVAGSASALLNIGSLANLRGDSSDARTQFEESLILFRKQGDKKGIAAALMHLGGIIRQQGDYDSCRTLLEESLVLRRELEDSEDIATTLSNLGNVVRLQGQHDQARALLEESVEIRQQLGDKKGLAWSLSALGSVALWLGDFEEAQSLHEQSLKLRRELGDPFRIAWAVTNLGTVAYNAGNMAQAKTRFTESLKLFGQLGNRSGIAAATVSLGRVLCVQGNLVTARTLIFEGFSVHSEFKDKEAIADDLMTVAELSMAEKQTSKAVRLWGAADTLRKNIGMPLAPFEQIIYAGQQAQAKSLLGTETFAAEWASGLTLTWDEAVTYALKKVLPHVS